MMGLFDSWMNDIFDGKRRWREEVKVCVHSCGLSSEAWTQIEKVRRIILVTSPWNHNLTLADELNLPS